MVSTLAGFLPAEAAVRHTDGRRSRPTAFLGRPLRGRRAVDRYWERTTDSNSWQLADEVRPRWTDLRFGGSGGGPRRTTDPGRGDCLQ